MKNLLINTMICIVAALLAVALYHGIDAIYASMFDYSFILEQGSSN